MGIKTGKTQIKSPKSPWHLVEVLWDDAVTEIGWRSPPDALVPQLAVTVGFLVKETPDHFLIASTHDGEDFNATIQIPKKMIVKWKTLRKIKTKKEDPKIGNQEIQEQLFREHIQE